MKQKWTYNDCLDLEYLIDYDRDADEHDLHVRDRKIYLEIEKRMAGARDGASRAQLVRAWLDFRKEQFDAEMEFRWPGRLAGEVSTLLRTILVLCLFLSGVSSGVVYFHYSGIMPVNVLPFFMIFVVLQIVLVLALLSRACLWLVIKRKIAHDVLFTAGAALAVRLFQWFMKKGAPSVSAERRLRVLSLAGRWRMLAGMYGSLFFPPFFVTLQVAAIAFNIGLLSSSFLRIAISDIAFGWQSTLQISAESLYGLVRFIALPWRWLLGEGVGYPSLADVVGSHIVLKEGISRLATENLVSWWPFLLLSVAVYGLGGRVCLLIYGLLLQRREEGKFRAESAATERILQRMQTPVLSSQASLEQDTPPSLQEEQEDDPVPGQGTALSSTGQCMDVLLPDEWLCEIAEQRLLLQIQNLLQCKGFHVAALHRYQVGYEDDQALLHVLSRRHQTGEACGVVVFVESWMAPLVDFLTYLRTLRKGLGEHAALLVWLLGQPEQAGFFAAVPRKEHVRIWQEKLRTLGDRYLAVVVQDECVSKKE